MKTLLLPLVILLLALNTEAFRIPVSGGDDHGEFEREFEHEISPFDDYDVVWIEIPDILTPTTTPTIAHTKTATGIESGETGIDRGIPRLNDISADLEYGFFSNKTEWDTLAGMNIAVKAKYERSPDFHQGYGLRLQYELTNITNVSWGGEVNPSNYVQISPFYRRNLTMDQEIGVMANVSFNFQKIEWSDWNSATDEFETVDSLQTNFTLNPIVYYTYRFGFGPVSGSAGAFGGYLYAGYNEDNPHHYSYAGLLNIGTIIGSRMAIEAEAVFSHQFLILGSQMPIYMSRYFSLTPGIKWPIVFDYEDFSNLRFTLGVSSRF